MAESFPSLRAAAIDGRAHNIYYRQHQLEALHQALLDHASEIKEAIAADYNHSPAEIAIEINLALSSLRSSYETLQPSKALVDEYLIASGSDAPANRVPAGIVYIEPCAHTLFYSLVAPLGAAIAAGNCVVVLLENKLRSLSTVLRQTLQQALHPVTFAIASSPVREASILDAAILVDQNSSETWPKSNQLASPSRNRTFAVVDRTADIKLAARELVAARFAFGGSSPYAPDLVLVNEFVKQEFSQAVVDESRKLSSGTQAIGDVKSKSDGSSKNDEKIGALKKADRHLQIALQESNAVVVDLHTRRSELLETKTEAPTLAVHAIKSLDDAIDFIGSAESGPALAAYHFGNAQVSKYLAQFVDARASFVNHVPRELLVGPAHPASHVIDVAARYTVDMFSLARPAFTKSSPTSSELAAALSSANSTAARKLLEQALQPLKITKRMPGGGISAVGFFEQGILIGLSMILTVTVSATAAGAIWFVRNGRIPSWGLRA